MRPVEGDRVEMIAVEGIMPRAKVGPAKPGAGARVLRVDGEVLL
jgi:hypothetical protein